MAEKAIVLTTYGKDDNVECFSISLFNKNEPHYSWSSKAYNYCDNINALELKDNKWVCAGIIHENKKIILPKRPLQLNFDTINQLDDRSIQKVIRELDTTELVKALLGASEETKEAIFRNCSEKVVELLEDDMEALRGISEKKIKSSQNKILEIIKHLIDCKELVFRST
jgi:flagellar motor switch protein FliG